MKCRSTTIRIPISAVAIAISGVAIATAAVADKATVRTAIVAAVRATNRSTAARDAAEILLIVAAEATSRSIAIGTISAIGPAGRDGHSGARIVAFAIDIGIAAIGEIGVFAHAITSHSAA